MFGRSAHLWALTVIVSFDHKKRGDVYKRQVLLSLKHCKKILLQGVTFMNSPAWNLHPFFCEDLTVDHVKVRNPYYAQNGDGIDVESCTNVHIHHCTFETGDDGICVMDVDLSLIHIWPWHLCDLSLKDSAQAPAVPKNPLYSLKTTQSPVPYFSSGFPGSDYIPAPALLFFSSAQQ